MQEVREYADKLLRLRAKKKELEEAIKTNNEEIRDIEEYKLAPMLDDMGITQVHMSDMDISRSVVFRGNCTKSTDKEAFQYLFDTDNDGALSKLLIVNYEAYPEAVMHLIEADIPYRIEYSIHHATLSSIIRELVEAGKLTTEDIENYRIYMQPQVKVKEK